MTAQFVVWSPELLLLGLLEINSPTYLSMTASLAVKKPFEHGMFISDSKWVGHSTNTWYN